LEMSVRNIVNEFPWTVIESPKPSFEFQDKFEMRVASLEQGGPRYQGPERNWPARWYHTSAFYVLEPVELGVYMAESLNNRFHYQILKTEEYILDNIRAFVSKNPTTKLHVIGPGKNY
jgi:hypothetical protein